MDNNHDLIQLPEISKNANGGTEIMLRRLYDGKVQRELLEKFQIIPTRVSSIKLDESKYRILWLHDLAEDPETHHLADGGWRKFHKIVFVSNWQAQQFITRYEIPWSHTAILLNAIDPVQQLDRDDDEIHLIYHTTPHRGLQLLLPVFDKLCEKHDNLLLNVYSSYDLYGWGQRDEQFKAEFEYMANHPKITSHGAVSQEEVRKALGSSDIFAYPSIWPETSCLCLMEAMSAGLCCVHSNFGALYETAANWTNMYNFHEDANEHANIFYMMLDNAIEHYRSEASVMRRKSQKAYVDAFYNWTVRAGQWNALLQSIVSSGIDTGMPEKEFVYQF